MTLLHRPLGLQRLPIQRSCTARPSSALATPPTPTKKRGRPPLVRPASPIRHDSLSSFEAHAAATSLSQTSPVYIGTRYEYLVQAALHRLGFSLVRTGGASDLGIDLRGSWTLPSGLVLPTLVQCKAFAPSPSMVRELAGAGREVEVRLLATRGSATRGVTEAVQRSRAAMGFVGVDGEGVVRQMVWNRVAEDAGLQGLGVGLRMGGAGGEEVVLTWQGKVVRSKASWKDQKWVH